jgi:hypothetical protein
LAPSAEQATEIHFALTMSLDAQVVPELVEVKISPEVRREPAAISFDPSPELATVHHPLLGALVSVQVVPELTEV